MNKAEIRAGVEELGIIPAVRFSSADDALKTALPQIPLVASGGVRQHTVEHFIHAGATAIGIGRDLLPSEAIHKRNATWIRELAHRFLALVKHERDLEGAGGEPVIKFK